MKSMRRPGRPFDRRTRKWPRRIALASAVLLALRPASAHPLGQQSVDHDSRLNITPGKVILVYTLDMAEIATAQEIRRADLRGDGRLDEAGQAAYAAARAREAAAGLGLGINGRSLALTPVHSQVMWRNGEANLPTLRLVAVLETAPGALAAALVGAGPQAGSFRDDNDPDRSGWHQIEVSGLGTRIVDESVNGGPVIAVPVGIAAETRENRTDARAVAFHFVPRADERPVPELAGPTVARAGGRASAWSFGARSRGVAFALLAIGLAIAVPAAAVLAKRRGG